MPVGRRKGAHMKVSGGELVIESLIEHGINKAYGIVGYYISPLLIGSLNYNFRFIDVRHEQAAVNMANGSFQVSRVPAAAFVAGAPGFTNTISGIIKAYMANTPFIVIVGTNFKTNKYSGGLQDINQIEMVREYSKWAITLYDAGKIPEYIELGIKKALAGKMGPVVIEIPVDVLEEKVERESIHYPSKISGSRENYCNKQTVETIVNMIIGSKKPVIIAGDEIYYQKASEELVELAESYGLPVFTINKARGCIPDSHELCFGNGRVLDGGHCLTAYRNTDCIILLGMHIDYQMQFMKAPFFNQNATIINIGEDIDSNGHFTGKAGIMVSAALPNVLRQISTALAGKKEMVDAEWINELKRNEQSFYFAIRKVNRRLSGDKIDPVRLIDELQNKIPNDSYIVLDGSNAMFWGQTLFKCEFPGCLINGPDGNLGAMGTGLPLALAAKLESPDRTVVLYSGDGSFGFNAIEIDTAIRFQIPILIIIHNDLSWGYCKSTQVAFYGEKGKVATELGLRRYDKLVASLGGYGELITDIADLDAAVARALASNKIACLNVVVDGCNSPGADLLNQSLVREN